MRKLLRVTLLVVGFFGVMVILGKLVSLPLEKQSTIAESAGSVQAEQQFNQCTEKLKQAQQLDVLYDMRVKGTSADIVVGPTWYTMPLDAKEGFNDTVQCFLTAGKGGAHMGTKYLDWRSGKVVAELSFSGRLKVKD